MKAASCRWNKARHQEHPDCRPNGYPGVPWGGGSSGVVPFMPLARLKEYGCAGQDGDGLL